LHEFPCGSLNPENFVVSDERSPLALFLQKQGTKPRKAKVNDFAVGGLVFKEKLEFIEDRTGGGHEIGWVRI
jgi:hypothetical protein